MLDLRTETELARPYAAPLADAPTQPPVAAPEPPTHPIPFTRTHIWPEARQAVLDVMASGWVTSGGDRKSVV